MWWTDQDTKILKHFWGKMSAEEIGLKMNKNIETIAKHARKLGLPGPYATRAKKQKYIEPPNEFRTKWRQSRTPHLLVSETGEIWNTQKGAYVKTKISKGCEVFTSRHQNIVYSSPVGRFVYETWKGKIPEGYVVFHIDNNFRNHDISNLAITTKSRLSAAYGRKGTKLYVYVNGKPVKSYRSVKAYADAKGISMSSVHNYLFGRFPNQRSVKEDLRYAPEKQR